MRPLKCNVVSSGKEKAQSYLVGRGGALSMEEPGHLSNVHCAQPLGHVQLLATPWTGARWAPLSTGFPRQEY